MYLMDPICGAAAGHLAAACCLLRLSLSSASPGYVLACLSQLEAEALGVLSSTTTLEQAGGG